MWLLALPMTAEMGFLSLFNIVDLFWIGKLGQTAMAALMVSSTLRFTLMSIGMGLGMGGTALVARRIGERDYQGASDVCLQAIILAVSTSASLGIAGYLLAEPMVRLLGASPDVAEPATAYLRIIFAGLLPTVMLPIGNSLLRGAGSANASLFVRAFAMLACILLEPPLIFGLGPIPAMGILGSALAVALGRGVGTLLLLYILWRGLTNVRLDLAHFKVDLGVIRRIVDIGLPGMVQYSMRSVGRIFLVAILAPFGTLALASWAVANQVSRVIMILAFGIGGAATTLVGQNLGAGKPERAARSAWTASGLGMGIIGLASVALFFAAPFAVRIFNPEPEIVIMGSTCLRILTLGFVFLALGMTMGRSLSGAGSTLPPMVISLASLWLIQLPLALALRDNTTLGVRGIWAAIAISNVASGLANTFWFNLGRWKRKRI